MSVHINLLPRKTIRERVWKTLNVVVGVTTILNVSLVGALVAPRAANAAVGSITLGSITHVSSNIYKTSGSWNPQGNQCFTPGNGFHYKVYVYDDLNGNGAYDVGEKLTEVVPAACNGDFTAPVSSGDRDQGGPWPASGQPNASFSLTQGTHTICAVLIHVNNQGNDIAEANYCYGQNQEGAFVSGYKFSDANGDGNWDGGEVGLEDWQVNLTGRSPKTTNSSGYYEFQDVSIGAKTLSETQQSGWIQTAPPAPGTYSLNLNYGDIVVGNFGNKPGQCAMTVDKFVKSGDQWVKTPTTANPGDVLYYKIVVTNTGTADCTGGGIIVQDVVDSQLGTPVGGTLIHADPGYEFTSPPTPWWNSTTRTLTWNAHTLHAGENATIEWSAPVNVTACGDFTIKNKAKATPAEIPAGIWSNEVTATGTKVCTGTVSGQKYNDLNGNGSKNAGEPGLSGWTIQLKNTSDVVLNSTVTDGSGNYSFTPVAGTYRLREVGQGGWLQTTVNPDDIVLVAGQNVTGVNFGNFQKVSISGQKYNDLNGNGSKNAGEPGLSGWTIQLKNTSDVVIDSAVTDGSGNYSFSDLGPGTFRLREVGQTGWTQTTTNPVDVTAISGTNVSDIDFGNHRDTGSITVNKMVDPENDGSFIGVGGDETPFRWGVDTLDGATTPRFMGSSVSGLETLVTHSVKENDVPGYHLVGWFYNDEQRTCENAELNTDPLASLTVEKGGTTEITFCNARDTGDLTIHKYDDNQNPLSGVTFTTGSYTGQTDQTGTLVFSDIPTGPYVVTETKPDNYHFSSVSGDCSPNANPTNVTVTTEGEQCTFTNARDMGGLRIIKQVNNDFGGTKGPGDFLINVKQSGTDIPGSPFAGVGDPGQLFPLPTGEYTISEDTVPGGYALQSINCEVGDPSSPNRATSVGEPPISQTVEIVEGEEMTCTVTNQDIQPKLTVTKVVNNDNGGTKVVANFPLFVNAAPVTSGVQNGFNADAYTVSEGPHDGYTSTIGGDCAMNGSITLNPGDVKSCTITNDDQQATLTVIKHVINNNGGNAAAGNFTMNVTGSAATASFPGAETPGTTINVNPGSYYVDESGPGGYTASSSGDCDDSIALGEHKTCTITNDDIAPTITLTKVVNNNHGGTAGPNDFGLTVGGTAVTSGQILPVMANTPIALNEVGKTGYSFVSITGNELCPSALGGTVTLTPGQNISCTITNNDQAAHLTVIKHVVNDNGGIKTASDFTMTISGVTVVGTGTFAGVESPGVTREVAPGVYNITETQLAGYAASFSADCAGAIALGESKTCTITNNDIVSVIGLVKTAAPAIVAAGGNITYTLAWSVTGTNPVTNAVITDPIPANTSFVSAANGGTFSAGTVTWNLGTLAGGSSGTVSFIVKAASPIANGTVITNTGTFDTTETSPVTSIANTPVTSAPSLSITKTNDVVGFTNPGKSVTYTVIVTNAVGATDTAKNVVLTDTLPSGFTFADTGLATKTTAVGDLAPGASKVFTFLVNISGTQATGVYTNTAAAKGDNTTTVTATSNVDVRVPAVLGVTSEPTLAITKTVDVKVTNPGKNVTYTVTLNNPGDTDVTNVSLTDTLPTGFTFVDSGKATKTWSIGTLKAHHQRVINYLVKIGDGVKAGKYDNTAMVLSNELDPQTAKASVEVKVPQVLGLATTGISLRDYLVFTLGLGSIILGLYWAGRQRRTYGAVPV